MRCARSALSSPRRDVTAVLAAGAAKELGRRFAITRLDVFMSDRRARDVAAFRKGLQESGYVEGQNVTVEYHWLEGQYDRLPALMADLVRRPVTVIAIPGLSLIHI